MTIGLLSELLRKNDDNFTWLSLTNNEIGIAIPDFTEALLHNVTLKKVSCHAGFLGSLDQDDLTLLMKALSQLPQLQDLWVALPPKHAHWSANILSTILLQDKQQQEEEEESSTTTTTTTKQRLLYNLSKLTIRGVDDEGCFVLARALTKKKTSHYNNNPQQEGEKTHKLTDLQIRGTTASTSNLGDGLQSQVTKEGILAIAKMLQVNTYLERLDLSYKGLDDECLQAMAQALQINKSLQKLELNNCCSKAETTTTTTTLQGGYQALVDTMRTNYTLQYLSTPVEGGETKYMMELLAKLNRTGARALMRNTTDHTALDDVLEMVAQLALDDATAVYELLRLNPSLWDPVKANAVGLNSSNSPRKQKKNTSATFGNLPNQRASAVFVKPPCDQAGSACASTVAQVAKRSSTFHKPETNNAASCSSHHATSTTGMRTAKRTSSAADKPVMARWNENIFTKLDEEKRQNYKRWTPTIIEKAQQQQHQQGSVVPLAELTSASEEDESGSESDKQQQPQAVTDEMISVAAAPKKKKSPVKRPWKRRSKAIISYDVPAVVATPPETVVAAAVKPAPEETLITDPTGADTKEEEPIMVEDAKPPARRKCAPTSSDNDAAQAEAASGAPKPSPAKTKRNSRRQRPIVISYDAPAIVASVAPTTMAPARGSLSTTASRANNVARQAKEEKGLSTAADANAKTETTGADAESNRNQSIYDNGFWIEALDLQDTNKTYFSASLPTIRTDELLVDPPTTTAQSNHASCPSSPLASPAVYGALAIKGVAYIGSAMLRTLAIGRNKSW